MDALGPSAWLITLAVAGVFFVLCAHVTVRLVVVREDGPAIASLRVRWFFLQLRGQINLEEAILSWVQALLDRAYPDRKAADQSRINLWRELVQQILRASASPRRFLARRIWCRRVQLHMEVGTGNAMETALLCGGVWAVVGSVPTVLSGWVRLERTAPDLCVQPNFDARCLRVRTECILRVRVANAIIAAIWFAVRVLRTKGLVAWMRDRRFRKGVVQDGGTPDSGADENGHGVAQNDGGRQHRHR